MKYRPPLSRIRNGLFKRATGEMVPLLQWLRTVHLDFTSVSAAKSVPGRSDEPSSPPPSQPHQQQQQQRGVGCAQMAVASSFVIAVKHVTVQINDPSFVSPLFQSVRLLQSLVTLDLQQSFSCFVVLNADDLLGRLLRAVGRIHGPSSLQVLRLPFAVDVSQDTLNEFVCLRELHVPGNSTFTSVDFCAETLRELYASSCVQLTNRSLQRAVHLEVLHVRGCGSVTTVAPFAHSLRELDASSGCGIGSQALQQHKCLRLQVLDVRNNRHVVSLAPFGPSRLRELRLGGVVANVSGSELALASSLVLLDVSNYYDKDNDLLPPEIFTSSLRDVSCSCQVTDSLLARTTQLVQLTMGPRSAIRSLEFCSSSLLELSATNNLTDAMLAGGGGGEGGRSEGDGVEGDLTEEEDDDRSTTTTTTAADVPRDASSRGVQQRRKKPFFLSSLMVLSLSDCRGVTKIPSALRQTLRHLIVGKSAAWELDVPKELVMSLVTHHQ